MNFSNIRVVIIYEETRKLVFYDYGLEEKELIQRALLAFNLNTNHWEQFELIIKALDCKVENSQSLALNDILLLKFKEQCFKKDSIENKEESLNVKALTTREIPSSTSTNRDINQIPFNKSSLAPDIRKDNVLITLRKEFPAFEDIIDKPNDISTEFEDDKDDEIKFEETEIDIEVLFEAKFLNREDLKRKIVEWCSLSKMVLNFKTQERENKKDHTKVSTLVCSKKAKFNCGFYLRFCTDPDSQHYVLTEYYNVHNHPLEIYDNSNVITEEIFERIKFLKMTNADTLTITDIINKDYEKKFHWRTIYYQLKKITDIDFGKPNEDSLKLIQILEQDSAMRGGFSKIEKNQKDELLRFSLMTKRMIKLANNFNDVIIIDTTHKSNRFNMPLLDIVVINNLGKTSTCFFSLLNDQRHESFCWALEQFKSKLTKNPSVIFSDDEEALTQGIFLIFSY